MTSAADRRRQHRQLDAAMARGMGWVALFAAVASAARLGQDIAVAWRFGTGPVVDAYYYLLSAVNWPVAVALSVLTILFAPASTAAARAQGLRRELLGNGLVVALASIPLAWWALQAIAARAEPAAAREAAEGVMSIVWAVPLGLIGALLSAWLVAAGRHGLALLEGVPSFVVLALLLMIPANVLFWGTTLGLALQALAMALLLRRAGQLPRPSVGLSSGEWGAFLQGAGVLLVAQALSALVPLVDAFIAARLGEGAVAALSYTNRLVLGLQGLAGLALQRSGLPLLSGLAATAPAQARRATYRWAAGAAIIGAAMAVVVALLADPLVAILYERGRFTPGDRAHVATLLRYGMLQMPVLLCGMVFITALAAIGARRSVALVAVINAGVKVLASLALAPTLGLEGLLMATAVMYFVGATAAGYAFHLSAHAHDA